MRLRMEVQSLSLGIASNILVRKQEERRLARFTRHNIQHQTVGRFHTL